MLSFGMNGKSKIFRATVNMVPYIPAETIFDKRIEKCINKLCND